MVTVYIIACNLSKGDCMTHVCVPRLCLLSFDIRTLIYSNDDLLEMSATI